MSSKGQAFALPSYDEIPLSEHSQTFKLVLEVCQSQQERIALLEETVAQLKDEIAILKGEKPRPKIKPSTLNQDQHEGEGPSRGEKGKDRRAAKARSRKSWRSMRRKFFSLSPCPRGRFSKAMKITSCRACGYGSTTRSIGERGSKRREEKLLWASYRQRSAGVLVTRS